MPSRTSPVPSAPASRSSSSRRTQAVASASAPASRSSSSRRTERARNIDRNQCLQLFINYLTRNPQNSQYVTNPITGNNISITATTFRSLLQNCMLRCAGDQICNRLSSKVDDELHNRVAWSLYSSYTFLPSIPRGNLAEFDDAIQAARTAIGIIAPVVPAPVVPAPSNNDMFSVLMALIPSFTNINVMFTHAGWVSLSILQRNDLVQAYRRRFPDQIITNLQRQQAVQAMTMGYAQRAGIVDSRSSHRDVPASGSSPARRSAVNSKSLNEQEEIDLNAQCAVKFRGVVIPPTPEGAHVKKFLNKLKKVCHKIVDKSTCTIQNLDTKLNEMKPKCNDRAVKTLNLNADDELVFLYNTWKSNPLVLRTPISKFKVEYPEDRRGAFGADAVDAGGLRRHFFQTVGEQLLSRELLSRTEEGEEIYNLNYDVNVLSLFGEQNTDARKANVFKFVGELTAWMMINKFNISGHFNKAILANLLYKDYEVNPANNELTDDDYALFYMLDYPTIGTSQAGLLQTPEAIEYAMIEFNDGEINLDPSIPADTEANTVTSRTYRRFIGLTGRYHLIDKNMAAFQAFKQGFHSLISRRYMRNKNFTITMLDSFITTVQITDEQIAAIVQSIMDGPPQGFSMKPLLCNIIKGLVEIPEGRFDDHDKALLPKNHKEFIPRFLKWISGSQNYVYGRSYNIRVITPSYRGTLPVAHTCSYLMDIPSDILTAGELFFRLLKAMINTGM